MSRNENSRFSTIPSANVQRSVLDRNQHIITTFNVGDLVPFYVDEILPADSVQIKTNKVVRLQPMVTAPYDDLYLDTYYFFVPNRLCWNHWKEFMGENTESAWIPTTEYTVPQIEAPADGWSVGTVADYLGIPTGVSGISVNALPFRALGLIYDEWFRDENLIDPIYVPKDETTVTGVNTDGASDFVKGGLPPKVAKYHDYFTSCLPAPQKGSDITIELLNQGSVHTTDYDYSKLDRNFLIEGDPLHFIGDMGQQMSISNFADVSPLYVSVTNPTGTAHAIDKGMAVGTTTQASAETVNIGDYFGLFPANLAVDPSIITINQLRTAFQLQRLLERDARGGTRYTESLKSHFGVTSPDARLQRPEYLGGNRISLNINQSIQTSQTTETSPQGNVAGYSLTADVHGDFMHSFVEHGFIIGVMCVRYKHSYQQGIERMWSRNTRFDYFYPVLANLGEQAVLNKEIFASGTTDDDEVFGYQERWSEYRYKPNRVSGEMRSDATTSLDVWHFADYYESCPALSNSWILEDKTNVDRVLAVQSTVVNQCFADLYIENRHTRPMPLYSVPGMIDHN